MFLKHDYVTGVNSELKIHFKKIVKNLLLKKTKSSNVLDIGSNDGTFLKNFPKQFKKFGFEPCKKIIVKDRSIKTVRKFFSYEESKKIKINFDIIHASGVFFHLEELHSVTKGMPFLRVSGTQMLISMGKMVFFALFIEFLLTLLCFSLRNSRSILVPVYAVFFKTPHE